MSTLRTILLLISSLLPCHCDIICISEGWRSNSARCRPLGVLWNNIDNVVAFGTKSNSKVTALYMKDCQLFELISSPFKNYKDLQLLDLSVNNIDMIQDNTFDGLAELRSLNLSNNMLTSISNSALKSLTKLRDLDLSSNNLKQQSTDELFTGLTFLRSLDLSNNLQLPEDSHLFKGLNLRSLTLVRSMVVFSEMFELNMPNLSYLDLSFNPQIFESGFMGNALQSCDDLIHLKLVSIGLTSIEAASLKQSRQLRILNLSTNSLEKLDQDVFSGNTGLMDLDLSFNQIERLPPTIFRKTFEIVVLNLSNNKVIALQPTLFSPLVKLRELDLSNNRIEILSNTVFNRNTNLNTLILTGNKIKSLNPITFSTNVEMRTLSFGNNQLKTFDYAIVEKMNYLSFLYLENNLLTNFSKDIIAKEALDNLYLSCNEFVSLPSDILTLSLDVGSKVIDLRGNPWNCGCLNEMLQKKSNVKFATALFADGKSITCFAGDDPLVCNPEMSVEDRMIWLNFHNYYPKPCISKIIR